MGGQAKNRRFWNFSRIRAKTTPSVALCRDFSGSDDLEYLGG